MRYSAFEGGVDVGSIQETVDDGELVVAEEPEDLHRVSATDT